MPAISPCAAPAKGALDFKADRVQLLIELAPLHVVAFLVGIHLGFDPAQDGLQFFALLAL
jgi:hypothetical protein